MDEDGLPLVYSVTKLNEYWGDRINTVVIGTTISTMLVVIVYYAGSNCNKHDDTNNGNRINNSYMNIYIHMIYIYIYIYIYISLSLYIYI